MVSESNQNCLKKSRDCKSERLWGVFVAYFHCTSPGDISNCHHGLDRHCHPVLVHAQDVVEGDRNLVALQPGGVTFIHAVGGYLEEHLTFLFIHIAGF